MSTLCTTYGYSRVCLQENRDSTGSVSDVTYSGNSIAADQKYGFLVSQSYSDDFGTPGTKSTIS